MARAAVLICIAIFLQVKYAFLHSQAVLMSPELVLQHELKPSFGKGAGGEREHVEVVISKTRYLWMSLKAYLDGNAEGLL